MANNTRTVDNKKNKLITCIKAPIKILMKAKNFYVSSIMQCSGRIGKGGFATGPGRPVNNGLLKNLSISSVGSSFVSEEDLRDLIRDASTRGHLNGLIQMDLLLQKHPKTNGISTAAALGYVPRSFTTGIGRIDEDKPCEFEDNDIRIDAIVRPRSRSHAVSWRRA